MKTKLRHRIIYKLVAPIMTKFLKKKFNFTYETNDIKPPFLVLANHTADFDPFFVAKGFSCPIYFVMSDHVSSLKAGKLIRHLVSPIPTTKSSIDAETVRNIFSVINQKGAVGIFPEGNKSFSGDVSWIKPSIAKLARKLNVPVVLYRIEGGYLSTPRWSKVKRKGHIHSYTAKVLTPDEIAKLSDEELYNQIVETLRVNAYDLQAQNLVRFECETDRAKHIESFLYACPECNSLHTIVGENNTIKCTKCGMNATLDEYGYIEGAPLRQLDQWDKFQKQLLTLQNFDDVSADEILLSDANWEVQKKETKYKSNPLGIYETRLTKENLLLISDSDRIEIPISDIAGTAIEGACSIQLWLKDTTVYRLKNTNGVNGLKYVNYIEKISGKPYKF